MLDKLSRDIVAKCSDKKVMKTLGTPLAATRKAKGKKMNGYGSISSIKLTVQVEQREIFIKIIKLNRCGCFC